MSMRDSVHAIDLKWLSGTMIRVPKLRVAGSNPVSRSKSIEVIGLSAQGREH
jgi:hypothetical protein